MNQLRISNHDLKYVCHSIKHKWLPSNTPWYVDAWPDSIWIVYTRSGQVKVKNHWAPIIWQNTLSNLIVLLMRISISIYIHNLSVSILQTGSQTEAFHQKILVDNFWSVGNKFTNGFTNEQSTQKKITCFITSLSPSGSLPYNRQNTICNSVSVFIFLSVYSSVIITYH